MVNVLEKEVENTYSLSKESRNITEGEVCQQSKEISNLESLCSKKDEQICPKTLIHGRCKGSSEKCPSPLKKKYKFNSDSEDEVNQQKVYPDFDFSADRDEQHLPQKVIVVSDSEQSNDVERIEKANSVSRHSSKQAGVLAKNILTPAAQPIKPQKRVDQDVLVCSKPDPQGLPLSGVSVKRPSTKFQSKVSRATALSTKNKNATAFDSRKEVVQDQTDGPSWSQGSNSLLDEDGLLYSTQPLRQKRNVEKHGKSTETLALVPEEMETLESKKIRDFNSLSTTELKGSKDFDRKRKAPITRNPISKRQAPGSIISWGKKESLNHEKNGGEATDENNFDTFSSLRNTRCDKSSVNSNREEKSSYLSEDENELDEKGNGTTKLLRNITSHKHTADEVRQARDEDQELQLPSGSNDATQDQRQASFLEELNNEVDEKALQACPICSREFPLISIEAHASTCGEEVDQDQQELDQKCNYCGERFMNNAVFQDHVNKCDLRRRQTRSRRVDQRLH